MKARQSLLRNLRIPRIVRILRVSRTLRVLLLLATAAVTAAEAQTTVRLPDTSLTTPLITEALDTAVVTVPSGVAFAVRNVQASSAASAASLSVTSILIPLTGRVKISVQAGAAQFTPPVAGAATWSAADVSWNAAAWSNGAGAAGTLTGAAFHQVATCSAGVLACSTTGLVFSLGPKPAVKISGHHGLTIVWKFEAI